MDLIDKVLEFFVSIIVCDVDLEDHMSMGWSWNKSSVVRS